jgi:hypothetical protein
MELGREDWVPYFRSISSDERRLFVAIESVGPRVPVEERIEAMCDGVCTRHPLRSIAYEHHADMFEVALGIAAPEGPLLRYFVAAPRQILVREDDSVRAIVVTDAGDTRTLVCVFSVEPRGPHTARIARPLGRRSGHRHQSPNALHILAPARPDLRDRRPATPWALARPAADCAARRHR